MSDAVQSNNRPTTRVIAGESRAILWIAAGTDVRIDLLML